MSTGLSRALTGFAAAALWAAFLVPAHGQSLCMGRTSLLTQLYIRALEQPVAIGLTSSGTVIEVLASEDGETWTIIATGPTGISCVVQAGENWQPIEPPKGPEL